ncbi:tetratricopeptide repeat-containing glycosyltransferase family 2 protein [Candidatus Soleaferrea massiliensis]|uniref:tetratricopeptide repeat-containing glycosyltransferase family 2 protein n=1 Tax=Candidatus Soleaferrea massiliensis TaxID=1470354 RepID=UPI0006933A76|nr:glycosyltransferase family 2 protein [Candidatus Soleaferrea massiliensis]
MISISLCMIVRDEEDVIGRNLECAKEIADEIIVVDTGSKDRTKEIALSYTRHVYDFEWIDDFAAARNFSFSKATGEYIMWLDADDVLLPEDREKLIILKETLDPAVDLVMMKYNVAFDAAGNPTMSYYRERLFKRSCNYQWVGAVHEVITPSGYVVYEDIAVTHKKLHAGDPDRNLRIFQKMKQQGKALDPRQQFYYGRELYYHALYLEAAAVLEAFLQEGRGWVENNIDACQTLSNCYQGLHQEEQGLQALFRSFQYDEPRAEICCDIGRYFFEHHELDSAIFWYELAANRPRTDIKGGFQSNDCHGYIPYIQLCVCYSRLGQHEQACFYNEKAAEIKPSDPAVLYNREYFKMLESAKKMESVEATDPAAGQTGS